MPKSSATAHAVAVPTSDTHEKKKLEPEPEAVNQSWHPDAMTAAREAEYARNGKMPNTPPSRGHILERVMALGGPRRKSVHDAPVSSSRGGLHVRGMTDERRAQKQNRREAHLDKDLATGQPCTLRRERVGTPDVRRPVSRRAAR